MALLKHALKYRISLTTGYCNKEMEWLEAAKCATKGSLFTVFKEQEVNFRDCFTLQKWLCII